MPKELCVHERGDSCNQCRLEGKSDEELLEEVEGHARMMTSNGFIPRGWWIELAKRLRKVHEAI